MTRHRLLHVLLATVVAFWSPAWCCCRIVGAGPCSMPQRPACAEPDTGGEHLPPCCRHDDQSPPRRSDKHHGECGCQNHERVVTLDRVIVLPALDLAGTLSWPVMTLTADPAELGAFTAIGRLRGEDRVIAGMVRAQTLFARRCLLLI